MGAGQDIHAALVKGGHLTPERGERCTFPYSFEVVCLTFEVSEVYFSVLYLHITPCKVISCFRAKECGPDLGPRAAPHKGRPHVKGTKRGPLRPRAPRPTARPDRREPAACLEMD